MNRCTDTRITDRCGNPLCGICADAPEGMDLRIVDDAGPVDPAAVERYYKTAEELYEQIETAPEPGHPSTGWGFDNTNQELALRLSVLLTNGGLTLDDKLAIIEAQQRLITKNENAPEPEYAGQTKPTLDGLEARVANLELIVAQPLVVIRG